MDSLSFPFLTAGLASLLVGAGVVLASGSAAVARPRAVIFALLSLAGFLAGGLEAIALPGTPGLLDPLLPWLEADALNAVPMIFFGCLTLFFLLLAPKRDSDGRQLAGMLIIAFATLLAYAAGNLVVMVIGWWLAGLPFLLGLFGPLRGQRLAQGFLFASCIALTAAVVLLHNIEIQDLSHVSVLAFSLLILAVILRKGIVPFHSWLVSGFEHGPLLPTALLFNGHLGALLIARSEAVALPLTARHALDILCMAALVTALITSLRGCVERKPRRLLAYICVSQASFILAGLATANAQGVTGALLHWLVVAAASSGLICIVRVIEVRVRDVEDPLEHLGLAVRAPRLATFFLICGLALAGLPGTLGYCAEDLLFHGSLESHPWLGIALLLATAFNAIHLIRLFGLLFLGVLPKHVIDIPDALPRERWPLAACIVFLIAGGLAPTVVIAWRAPAARAMTEALGAKSAH